MSTYPLLQRLVKLNFRPLQVYGLTETYAPIVTNRLLKAWEMLPLGEPMALLARQRQGHVTADVVRVVDENVQDVPRDGETLGEVVMRGNIVMKGYYWSVTDDLRCENQRCDEPRESR